MQREAGGRPGHDAALVEGVDREDHERQVEEADDDSGRHAQDAADQARLNHRAAPSQRLEGAEAPGDEQVADHHHDRQHRVGRGDREVAECRVVVDHVANELRVGHEVRDDVVAQAEREGEDRARHEGRNDERQHDPAECRPRLGPEVGRGLEQRTGDPLEPGVDRQDHVRQPQVAEHEPRVRQLVEPGAGDAERAEDPGQKTVSLEDRAPGVRLHQVRRPERQQHGHDQRPALPRRGDAGHVVGDREGEQRIGQGDRHRDPDRPQRDGAVDRVAEDLVERLQRPVERSHLAGEGILRPEGVHQQDEQRAEVDDHDPAERDEEEEPQLCPGPRVQPAGDAPSATGGGARGRVRGVGGGHRPIQLRGGLPREMPPRGASMVSVQACPAASAAAERGPRLDPRVLVLAGGRRVRIGAVRLRGGPVPDLLPVGLVAGVLVIAETGRDGLGGHAGRLRHRGLAEPDGRLGVRLRGQHVVHPAVHAVRVGGLRIDHPGVRPAGRALVGQDRIDVNRRSLALQPLPDTLHPCSMCMLRMRRRQHAIARGLPNALDLMVVCVEIRPGNRPDHAAGGQGTAIGAPGDLQRVHGDEPGTARRQTARRSAAQSGGPHRRGGRQETGGRTGADRPFRHEHRPVPARSRRLPADDGPTEGRGARRPSWR